MLSPAHCPTFDALSKAKFLYGLHEHHQKLACIATQQEDTIVRKWEQCHWWPFLFAVIAYSSRFAGSRRLARRNLRRDDAEETWLTETKMEKWMSATLGHSGSIDKWTVYTSQHPKGMHKEGSDLYMDGTVEPRKTKPDMKMQCSYDQNLRCDKLHMSFWVFESELENPSPRLSGADNQLCTASKLMFEYTKCAYRGAQFSWTAIVASPFGRVPRKSRGLHGED